MPVPPSSASELLELLSQSGVVPPERFAAAIPDPAALPTEARKAATVLVREGVLTKFQAQQLLAGRHKGFRLGPYAVLDQLGRGGMGAVYLAEHLELHRKVAIKVLAPSGEDHRVAAERFLREARSAAALDHPNIVRVFDVCRHNDVPCLVMEYVEGETLQHVIDRDGVVPYSCAADHVAQAAAGLQHAHEKGFVHRDIKPANLIRDRAGVVKILDMGLARLTGKAPDKLTDKLDHGAVIGTADFISPEQALNCPAIDIRADVYSLGATFYYLIAGKPPFEGNTTQKLLQHQMTAPPPLSSIDPSLPRGLTAVVARMLAKRPEDRYQTPAEVIAALAAWLGNGTRVLAGLSHTHLGQTVELQTTLQDLARGGSSRNLIAALGVDDPHPSAEVDASAARETGEISAAETTRTPPAGSPRPWPAPPKHPRGRKRLLLTGVLLGLGMGGVTGWLAFGKNPPQKHTQPSGQTTGSVAPPSTGDGKTAAPDGVVAPAPQPQVATERVVFRQDLSSQEPFTIRAGLTVRDDDPTSRVTRQFARSGPGQPPTGWTIGVWDPKSEMEFAAVGAPGGPALVIRNVSGPGSAMLFMPRFDCPSGACRLTFEYCAHVREKRFAIRFKPVPGGPAWDVTRPPVTGDVWRTESLAVDLKGAAGGYFEFHNSDDNPAAAVRLRGVTLTEIPSAPTAPPQDLSRWAEKAVVFHLDTRAIPPFRVTKQGRKRTDGAPEQLPSGVSCYCAKPTAVGEFRCEVLDGAAALGLSNRTDEMSAQFVFDLESGLKLALIPGKVYRVKLNYLAASEAAGTALVQTPGAKPVRIASAELPGATGQWANATLSFERQHGTPARLVIENTSAGEGNTLWVRSVELVELEPPAKPQK